MKNRFLKIVINLAILAGIIGVISPLVNYFDKISTFEPVNVKVNGVSTKILKTIRVEGVTPGGKPTVFMYYDSLKSFYSYYGFLESMKIKIFYKDYDSIKSINISTGREVFNYTKKEIDSCWEMVKRGGGTRVELKSPPSLKTKETKIRIIATTRYWQLIKTVSLFMMAILVFVIILFIIRIVRRK